LILGYKGESSISSEYAKKYDIENIAKLPRKSYLTAGKSSSSEEKKKGLKLKQYDPSKKSSSSSEEKKSNSTLDKEKVTIKGYAPE